MSAQLEINPEFQSLIPPIAPGDRRKLEANIVADGCRDPLVAWNRVLVDGHNRHEICTRLGLPFKTVSMKFTDEIEAKLWILDNSEGKRNLCDLDRIEIQLKRAEILAEQAKEKQKLTHVKTAGPGRGKKTVTAKLRQPFSGKRNKTTSQKAAEAAGVGARTFDAGKLILEAAEAGEIEPELVEDVRRGRAAIHRVAKDIKEKRQRNARQTKRTEAAKSAPAQDSRIHVGDFRQLADKIPDGSLSLIFTDPPYDLGASKMLAELGSFAATKLADGGSLLSYVGQTQIPAALDAFRLHLKYFWTIACVHAGNSTIMREHGIKVGWKAVLWFVKGTRDNNSVFVSDVMSGGQEKSHHDWQQAQSEAEYWIEKLCPKDGVVCDPFLGGGTTGAAAKKLGREWVGFEVNEETAKIAAGRVVQ